MIRKIEVRIDDDNVLQGNEVWEIERSVGEELKISCNGFLVATTAVGVKPMYAGYEILVEHLRNAYDKLIANSLVKSVSEREKGR